MVLSSITRPPANSKHRSSALWPADTDVRVSLGVKESNVAPRLAIHRIKGVSVWARLVLPVDPGSQLTLHQPDS